MKKVIIYLWLNKKLTSMDINTIDDLIKYLSMYTQLIIGDYTKDKERSIVFEALELKIIKQSRENTFHLDRKGRDIVHTGLSLAEYDAEKAEENKKLLHNMRQPETYESAKKKNPNAIGYTDKPLPFGGDYSNLKPEMSDWDKAIKQGNQDAINEAIFQKTGIRHNQQNREFGTPIVLPAAPVEKISRKRKVLNFIADTDNKNVMQWTAWTFAIGAGILGLLTWLVVHLIGLNK